MLLIELIQEYWAIQDALRAARAIPLSDYFLQDANLVYTVSEAIPQLQAALAQKEQQLAELIKSHDYDVFTDVGNKFTLNPSTTELIKTLRTLNPFNEQYSPLLKCRLTFREFIETEHTFIGIYNELSDYKSHLKKALTKYLVSLAPRQDDDDNVRLVSPETQQRIQGFQDVLRDYQRVQSPFHLRVSEAAEVKSIEDMASWWHRHVFSNLFISYIEDQLQVWSINKSNWDTGLLQDMQKKANELRFSKDENTAIAKFRDGTPTAFQRVARLKTLSEAFLSIINKAKAGADAIKQVKELDAYIGKKVEHVNEERRKVSHYEDFLTDLKQLLSLLQPLEEPYAKVPWYQFEMTRTKNISRKMRNNLWRILGVVDEYISKVQKVKPVRATENDALICQTLSENFSVELDMAFSEVKRTLRPDDEIPLDDKNILLSGTVEKKIKFLCNKYRAQDEVPDQANRAVGAPDHN